MSSQQRVIDTLIQKNKKMEQNIDPVSRVHAVGLFTPGLGQVCECLYSSRIKSSKHGKQVIALPTTLTER